MTNPAMALMHDLITSDTGDYNFSEHWSMIELIDLYEISPNDYWEEFEPDRKSFWTEKFWTIQRDLAIEIANRACGLIRKYHEELNIDDRTP